MAKGSGGTRNASPYQKGYSFGNTIVIVDEGYPKDRAEAIVDVLRDLQSRYGYPIDRIELVNKTKVGVFDANGYADGKIIKIGTNNSTNYAEVSGSVVNGEWVGTPEGGKWIAVHEYGHLFPFQPKPTKPLAPIEKQPSIWEKYEEKLQLYKRNKKLNDGIMALYKDYKAEYKKYGVGGRYAASSPREFVAEGFLYRIRYGSGRDKTFDKLYDLLLQYR